MLCSFTPLNAAITEEIMVMQRRMMLGAMRDPTATMLTIVVTGVEEAALRCTMDARDSFFEWLTGEDSPTGAQLKYKRLTQAASAACGMRCEVTSIITSRLTYMMMRPHRFAFNFGYGFDASDEYMVSAEFLMASMFLELGLEVVVDGAATDIEFRHGIDVESFWRMWRRNPGHYLGVHVCSSLAALQMAFWAFSTLPSPFFCTSMTDPCSCRGGGFNIFKTFCDAIDGSKPEHRSNNQTNGTAAAANSATPINSSAFAAARASAKAQYTGLLESLEGNSTTVMVTGTVIVIMALIFFVARSQLAAAYAKRENEELEQQQVELIEQNTRIRLRLDAEEGPMKAAILEGASALVLLDMLEDTWVPVTEGSLKIKEQQQKNNKAATRETAASQGMPGEHQPRRGQDQEALDAFAKYWHDIVSAPDPEGTCLQAILSFLEAHKRHRKHLAFLQDGGGRSALDMSSPLAEVALHRGILFCGRFELEGPPVHVSQTCAVVFAKDYQPQFEQYQVLATSFASGSSRSRVGIDEHTKDEDEVAPAPELLVALKLMQSRDALQREIEYRGDFKKVVAEDKTAVRSFRRVEPLLSCEL